MDAGSIHAGVVGLRGDGVGVLGGGGVAAPLVLVVRVGGVDLEV